LLALYLVCLFLGGTLILASILLGGHTLDHSVGDHAGGDHDGGLHMKDFPVDKAIDLVKELPVAKDFPVDKALDLVKDLAKDVPHDATPSADGQTAMEQSTGSLHPSSGGDLGGPGLKALVSLRFWTFALASFGFLGAGLHVIGIAEPVSIMVNANGTGKVSDEKLTSLVRKHFDLTPKGLIEHLKLRRPIYRATAAYGHFGRTEAGFTWEKTDKARLLANSVS